MHIAKGSLVTKAGIAAAALSIFVGVAAGVLSFYVVNNQTIRSINLEMQYRAETIAIHLNSEISDIVQDLKMMAVTRLEAGTRLLADADHALGAVSYQSFDAADYERFYGELVPIEADEWWAILDNGKPGIDAVPAARSGRWPTRLVRAFARVGTPGNDVDAPASSPAEVVAQLAFAVELTETLGAPREVWVRWRWTPGTERIDMEVSWPDKAANRLPEALWCSFVPAVAEPDRWTIDKLGQEVSPLEVVRHGGRGLHGVGPGGLSYRGPDGEMRLFLQDAALVAPGTPNLLNADPPRPDMAGGWHVLLADNCWGTNFPMWIEGPMRYRFTLTW